MARLAILRYVLAWVCGGAIVVVLLALVLDPGARPVRIPPLHETSLTVAARDAGCRLGRPPRASPSETMTAARPLVYDRPPAAASLSSALRRGIVVFSYRAALRGDVAQMVRSLQGVVPLGTIVTSDPDLRQDVVAVAWRRQLTCPRWRSGTLDAVRLFRGRYIGQAPLAAQGAAAPASGAP